MWPCPRGANPELYKLQSPRAGNGDASSGRLLLRRVPAALGKWETCFPPSGLYSCLASSRAHYVNCQSARGRSLPFSIFPFWKTEPGAVRALGSRTRVLSAGAPRGAGQTPGRSALYPPDDGSSEWRGSTCSPNSPRPSRPRLLLGQKATTGPRRPGRRSPTVPGRGARGLRGGGRTAGGVVPLPGRAPACANKALA